MPVASEPVSDFDSDTVAMGGVLALLVLGAGALSFARRRRTEVVDEAVEAPILAVPSQPVRREVDLTPPVHAPPLAPDRSAFHWGYSAPGAALRLSPTEKARRGPTPDNPSLSLKKRLKRAAFFEQRERDAAAGRSPAVSRFAGLPARLAEAARPRPSLHRPVFQPA